MQSVDAGRNLHNKTTRLHKQAAIGRVLEARTRKELASVEAVEDQPHKQTQTAHMRCQWHGKQST